ncbi:MAG: heparan-alpha-glucosaminide N-acetyltransferase domain-containing protein [Microthrixaceae bacterium]
MDGEPGSITPATGAPTRPRLRSLDVLRGIAVVGMVFVNERGIDAAHPALLRHPDWVGFTLADTVFPLFLFCIGVSMAFARPKGWPEVLRRCAVLFAIGVALSFIGQGRLVFAGVLQHIAITSLLATVVLRFPRRGQVAAVVAILVGCGAVGVLGGFAVRDTWNVAANQWLYGRDTAEGVLVIVCSVANVVGGAWVGSLVRAAEPRVVCRRMVVVAAGCVAVALALAPWIPVIKREWTPTYALVGFASSCLFLAAVMWWTDVRGRSRGSGWLMELGANPLAVYVAVTAAADLVPDGVRDSVAEWAAALVGAATASLLWSLGWVLVAVALAKVLWRRGVIVKL